MNAIICNLTDMCLQLANGITSQVKEIPVPMPVCAPEPAVVLRFEPATVPRFAGCGRERSMSEISRPADSEALSGAISAMGRRPVGRGIPTVVVPTSDTGLRSVGWEKPRVYSKSERGAPPKENVCNKYGSKGHDAN